MIDSQMTPKRSWYLIATIIAFAALTVISIVSQVQQSRLKRDMSALQTEKQALESEMQAEINSGSSTLATLASVKEQLDKIEQRQLPWSRIVEEIDTTIPKVGSTTPIITVQSYNGNEEGKVALSAITRPDSSTPFSDIAQLIRAFVAKESFANVFVPSVTKTISTDGSVVLTFSFNFEFHKPTL